jgi:hypothetical protein
MRRKLTLAPVAVAAFLATSAPAAAQISGECHATGDNLNSILCTYSADAGTSECGVELTVWWSYGYQCLHEKTEKTNKKYGQLTYLIPQTGSGVCGGAGEVTFYPPVSSALPTNLCTENKGPYTVLNPLTPSPFSWRIAMMDGTEFFFIEDTFETP